MNTKQRSCGGTTSARLGVGAMNTNTRSRGGTTSARLGVGAMNTKQRSHGGQAKDVGTVEELTLRFLTNQSYMRKDLRKACDEGLTSFIEFMKKHFSFGCAGLKFQVGGAMPNLFPKRIGFGAKNGCLLFDSILRYDCTLNSPQSSIATFPPLKSIERIPKTDAWDH
jgi:hypothetical protein